MKTLIRTLVMLALIVWLGAEIFFPVVAGVAFTQLPDTHAAGMIVRSLLGIVHYMGMVCGVVLLALLALSPAWGIFKARHVLAPIVLVLGMIGLTLYGQFSIIPAMEKDRLQAPGGRIDSLPQNDPARVAFNMLHGRSTQVEGAVLVLGIFVVTLLGYAESAGDGRFAR